MKRKTPRIGDKVTTRQGSFTRCTGVVTAVLPETIVHVNGTAYYERAAGVAVYCGKYESTFVPMDDVVVLGKYNP